jgi:hypothetical protein
MNTINRRELCAAHSSFAALAATVSEAQAATQVQERMAIPPSAHATGEPVLSVQRTFPLQIFPW